MISLNAGFKLLIVNADLTQKILYCNGKELKFVAVFVQ